MSYGAKTSTFSRWWYFLKILLKTIIEREENLFSLEWDNLTLNQQKALKIIIRKDGKNLYDEEYLVQYKLKVGSFQTALKGLAQKDIVDKVKNIYYLQDPLFEYWLKSLIWQDLGDK